MVSFSRFTFDRCLCDAMLSIFFFSRSRRPSSSASLPSFVPSLDECDKCQPIMSNECRAATTSFANYIRFSRPSNWPLLSNLFDFVANTFPFSLNWFPFLICFSNCISGADVVRDDHFWSSGIGVGRSLRPRYGLPRYNKTQSMLDGRPMRMQTILCAIQRHELRSRWVQCPCPFLSTAKLWGGRPLASNRNVCQAYVSCSRKSRRRTLHFFN